jgi:hypothetical protein
MAWNKKILSLMQKLGKNKRNQSEKIMNELSKTMIF